MTTAICPVCHLEYEADLTRLKHGRQSTCSRSCSYKLRSNKLFKQQDCVCASCGKRFTRSPSTLNKVKCGNNFCSTRCHYAGRALGKTFRTVVHRYKITERGRMGWKIGGAKTRKLRLERGNYSHSDATKSLLSHKTSLAIAEGRIRVISKPENIIAGILDDLHIPYERQVAMRGRNGCYTAVYDFMLQGNIAIEVNGTFYHSDPRFYPNGPIHAIQKRNLSKWLNKVQLTEVAGITLVEVWEYDIKNNIDLIVDMLRGLSCR